MTDAIKFVSFRAELSSGITEAIKEAQTEDESLQDLIRNTRSKDNLPVMVRKQFHLYDWEEGLLLYDNRVYVLED
jgi:hypothetical protein